jgi:hypothetical protein
LDFTFDVPSGYNVQKIPDNEGETILIQSPGDVQGVQIYIRFFNDPGSSITKERIESEVDESVTNDAPITVSNIAEGLQFDFASDTPPSHQAWFVYNGLLYQTEATDPTLLNEILASWKFRGQ